jgi:putative flavoprotein involved in K+ transport
VVAQDGGGYRITTPTGVSDCSTVVVATGSFGRTSYVPAFAAGLDPAILQLHFSQYRRPGQLADGPVLVVGASHSGADIAYEVAQIHETTLAGRDCGQIRPRLESPAMRAIFPLLVFARRHVATRNTPIGRRMMPHARFHGAPMLRVKRADLSARGVHRVLARVDGVRDGRPALGDGTVFDVCRR